MSTFRIGSRTAKGGFANEKRIVEKFNNWKKDKEAKHWLKIMGYKLSKIKHILALRVGGRHKTDVQVQIFLLMKSNRIKIENISIKRSENKRGYNQVDRRKVDSYKKMWDMPSDVVRLLKLFTGEIKPRIKKLKDKRRTFLTEMSPKAQSKIINFFSENEIMIVNDLFRGREGIIPSWFMVAYYDKRRNTTTYALGKINIVMNLYAKGPVFITKKGSLRIGHITMQRKGGTPDPESLQFKIDPMFVFNYL